VNAVLQTPQRLLLSVTTDELNGICNALSEVCHGVHIEDSEFETRIGVPRAFLADLLDHLLAGVKHPALRADTRAEAWTDGGSVQAICVTVSGDPADMSPEEGRVFADQLRTAIAEAEDGSDPPAPSRRVHPGGSPER
jgi:hypothetical protein